MRRILRILAGGALLCGSVAALHGVGAQAAPPALPTVEHVLIRTPKPYAQTISKLEAIGGRVTHQYKYVDAIAAEIPAGSINAARTLVGEHSLTKDIVIPAPAIAGTVREGHTLASGGDVADDVFESAAAIGAGDLATLATEKPDAYRMNNQIMNVTPLHAGNIAGQGVIVAVIDSGIRPGFPHLTLDGSVIGGDDFVNDGRGFSNGTNEGHGTFVAGMISANVNFTFGATSGLLGAARRYCPGCVTGATNSTIPMIGTAPLSSIYALRVFGVTGGAPTSRILLAVERVIELREKFDAGEAGGVNIQICNMSLGGPTIFAGRDLLDQSVDAMLDTGIVLAISAGNAGPSSLTGGSPGTSFEALTVGAANHAHNERILRDLQFGAGIGALYRPFSGTQTAYFSSRGPTADGRPDPDVTANGFASYGQGFASLANGNPNVNGISIASGTSFSGPSVAGVAALLRQAFPGATARQIRNAIILSANPNLLADGSTENDQGSGFVDAQAAFNLLAAGSVPDTSEKPSRAKKNVSQNVEQNTALDVRRGSVRQLVTGLKPAQRRDFLYEVGLNASQVRVTLSGFAAALPPAQQNQLFGDDIFLTIHSAQTSATEKYLFQAFTTGGTITINDPEPGIMRITVNGDWTNAGNVGVTVDIATTTELLTDPIFEGRIGEGQTAEFTVDIPAGTSRAQFSLSWKGDWSKYPANDIDMVVIAPNGTPNLSGATLDSPETVDINNPAAGTWKIIVSGFEIPTTFDNFRLRTVIQ